MSHLRVRSSPDLAAAASSSTSPMERPEEYCLEGIATNVRLLLKLIQDHREASSRGIDDHKKQRIAGMMTILDDVKTRIQKAQSFGRKREAELRRCNTDLKPRQLPRDKRQQEVVADEKERLKRGLDASLAARKSLEIMCSSLGKEKEIMASELARKVHEMNELEELVTNLKTQNEMLSTKVQNCAAEHRRCGGGDTLNGSVGLQDRNKELSEQLLRSLDGYRSMKRKLKDAQQENTRVRTSMNEASAEVAAGLQHVRKLKDKIRAKDQQVNVLEEISSLERMFEGLELKLSEHARNKG